MHSWIVILPSKNEADTIAAVTEAAAKAVPADSLLINVDASSDQSTKDAFLSAEVPNARRYVAVEAAGKGRQIMRALLETPERSSVLLLDTDTRNPSANDIAALMRRIAGGADVAVPNYRRSWFEANLTNHVARPLIAATTGIDIAQPLAGDFALSRRAVNATLEDASRVRNDSLYGSIEGYGIDAWVILTACAARLSIKSVPLDSVKLHAPSFPHIEMIFREAVPVLLAASPLVRDADPPAVLSYTLAAGSLPEERLRQMINGLTVQGEAGEDARHWPDLLVSAWRAVQNGADLFATTNALWPAYARRVAAYLELAAHAGIDAAAEELERGSARIISGIRRSR